MKILYVVSDDRYFCSHRMNVAKAAQQAGHQIFVACGVTEYTETILQEGFELIDLRYDRKGLNILGDLKLVSVLKKSFQQAEPDLIHVVALRMSLFAGIAAKWVRVPKRLYAITGLGHLFLARSWKIRCARFIVKLLLRWIFCHKHSTVVVQNQDDYALFSTLINVERLMLIPGSGVDAQYFQPVSNKEKHSPLCVILVARAIKEKGVLEFIAAAKLLKERDVACKMILVGDTHPANPSSLTQIQLQAFHDQGLIEWWGHREDMRHVWQETDIAVLPSYREGLPKSLLEAASCGLPIITTNVTGCRDVVEHHHTGWLIPIKSPEALANAIEEAIAKPELCEQYGLAARKKVLDVFSDTKIIGQFLALYVTLE